MIHVRGLVLRPIVLGALAVAVLSGVAKSGEKSDRLLHPQKPLRDLKALKIVLDDFLIMALEKRQVDVPALQKQLELKLATLGLQITPVHPLDSPTPQLHIYVGCYPYCSRELADIWVELQEPVQLMRDPKTQTLGIVWQHRTMSYTDSCTADVLQGKVLWAADMFVSDYQLANGLR